MSRVCSLFVREAYLVTSRRNAHHPARKEAICYLRTFYQRKKDEVWRQQESPGTPHLRIFSEWEDPKAAEWDADNTQTVTDVEPCKKKGQDMKTTEVQESPGTQLNVCTGLPSSPPSQKALFEEPKAAEQVADNTQTVTDVDSCTLSSTPVLPWEAGTVQGRWQFT